MYRKKQRGQQRKLKQFITLLKKQTEWFPTHHTCNNAFVKWSMPGASDFLNSRKTSGKIKSCIMQHILDRTQHLYHLKPEHIPFCKIVCVIDYPSMWYSQMIAFFDEEYYNDFFSRNDSYQIWDPIQNKSMQKIRNLRTIPVFREQGYIEKIYDEKDSGEIILTYSGELWFYGELEVTVQPVTIPQNPESR